MSFFSQVLHEYLGRNRWNCPWVCMECHQIPHRNVHRTWVHLWGLFWPVFWLFCRVLGPDVGHFECILSLNRPISMVLASFCLIGGSWAWILTLWGQFQPYVSILRPNWYLVFFALFVLFWSTLMDLSHAFAYLRPWSLNQSISRVLGPCNRGSDIPIYRFQKTNIPQNCVWYTIYKFRKHNILAKQISVQAIY